MIDKRAFMQPAACATMAALAPGLTRAARADLPYPTHSVRRIMPYTAGGATDVLSRAICQYLAERLGQPFLVENKPGAGSNIGTQGRRTDIPCC